MVTLTGQGRRFAPTPRFADSTIFRATGGEGELGESEGTRQAIAIGPRIVASGGFDALYREGMALIEEVASYLDGPGRAESRALEREAAFTYGSESMRLTTRLMQLASWLLLQRAVNEGELTAENARVEKSKVQFSATPDQRGGPGFDGLPEKLRAFIARGDRLFERVLQFDRLERGLTAGPPVETPNGVADQLSRLRAAFQQLSQ
jgi:regulator of CtrA degradation